MPPLLSLEGKRFGRLVVLSRAASTRQPSGAVRTNWLCRCDCGKTTTASRDNLRSGDSTSCGCLRREITIRRLTTHGEGSRRGSTAEYVSWKHAIDRCENRDSKDWPRYGGRGIRVCERWHSFEKFLADMGRRPSPKHSIDRINNDGHYEPGNCRWATKSEQAKNRRPLKLSRDQVAQIRIELHAGVRAADIASRFGVSASQIYRIRQGTSWPFGKMADGVP
ncbi:MAG: helix-turn-helix domain-containing protein [Planctomycetota bacterium]|jgi:hypothetical protein